jgi:hypothetical protein
MATDYQDLFENSGVQIMDSLSNVLDISTIPPVDTGEGEEPVGFENSDNIPNIVTIPDESEEDENPDGGKAAPALDTNLDTESAPEGSDELLYSFTSALVEKGVLSGIDPEKLKIKNVEDLFGLVQEEIKKNEYSDLTDEQKLYLGALRNGVPEEKVKDTLSGTDYLNKISDDIIEGDEKARQWLIYQMYLRKGFNEEKAAKMVERSVRSEEDIAEAKEAKEFLQQELKQTLQAEIAAKEVERKQKEEESKKVIANLKKEIVDGEAPLLPGVTKTKQLAEKVYKSMTEVVEVTPEGQALNTILKARRENPLEFEKKLHTVWQLTDGFTDFSYFGRTNASKKALAFEQQLKASGGKRPGDGVSSLIDPLDMADFVESARKIINS